MRVSGYSPLYALCKKGSQSELDRVREEAESPALSLEPQVRL